VVRAAAWHLKGREGKEGREERGEGEGMGASVAAWLGLAVAWLGLACLLLLFTCRKNPWTIGGTHRGVVTFLNRPKAR